MRPLLVSALVCLLAFASAGPRSAHALDIAMGSETLFQQVEGASVVVSARFLERAGGSLVFERDTLLAGSLGRRIAVASDPYVEDLELERGAAYLLCLRAQPDGSLRLRTSRYSVLAVPSAEMPAALDAVRVYLRDRADPERLAASLLRLAGSDSAFLQTSAITSLAARRLLTRDNLTPLLELARTGRVREPRARELLLQQAGWLRAPDARGVVASRLLDPAEDAGVRETALLALHRIDPRSVAAVMPRIQGPGAAVLQQRARWLQERTDAR